MMSRIIEFQGKTVNTGEWIVGNLSTENFIFNRFIKQVNLNFYIEELTSNNNLIRHLIIPDSVGQYTNLIGSDKKRIYDHDIVTNDIHTGEVYWNYQYNGWRVAAKKNNNMYDTKLDNTYKVVGHKYDEIMKDSFVM